MTKRGRLWKCETHTRKTWTRAQHGNSGIHTQVNIVNEVHASSRAYATQPRISCTAYIYMCVRAHMRLGKRSFPVDTERVAQPYCYESWTNARLQNKPGEKSTRKQNGNRCVRVLRRWKLARQSDLSRDSWVTDWKFMNLQSIAKLGLANSLEWLSSSHRWASAIEKLC